MNKIGVYALLGIFAFVLLSNSAVSTTWDPEAREIPFQVNHSDRIVIGTVKEQRVGFESTDVIISVDEWLKNPLPRNEITVRTERGTNAFTAGAANFSVGERVLLMLNDDDSEKGRFKMAFMELGKHPVSDRDGVEATLIKLASPVATTPQMKTAIWASEEKMLVVGSVWEKDGWNLSVEAVDKSATPGFVLISLSYKDKKLGDARIETGKSYTYMGKNPDGSEVALFAVKATIFVGASTDAVRLALNWSIPENNVQIFDVPVESDLMKTETPAPTPTAQASQAPGFEIVLGILGILAVCRILGRMNEK